MCCAIAAARCLRLRTSTISDLQIQIRWWPPASPLLQYNGWVKHNMTNSFYHCGFMGLYDMKARWLLGITTARLCLCLNFSLDRCKRSTISLQERIHFCPSPSATYWGPLKTAPSSWGYSDCFKQSTDLRLRLLRQEERCQRAHHIHLQLFESWGMVCKLPHQPALCQWMF